MAVDKSIALTQSQASALFDILTHWETYAEIQAFSKPDAVKSYGPPFQSSDVQSTSPLLQTILSRFLLPLPGVRDFGSPFWADIAGPLLSELAAANLSESFDKGDCGQRKTLATASSALLEYFARAKFGGLARRDIQRDENDYDVENPDDLVAGFDDLIQRLVYSDGVDALAKRVSETADIADHTKQVQAAHRFLLINFASFLHYVLIVSPKGPALLSLLESAHRLIPYTIMRQTLKVGNAATMINGMMSIVLTKASVGAFTNWLGLSSGSNEGMNLMQTIISTALGWDARGFKKRMTVIEKSKNAPSKDNLEKLRQYSLKPREQQEAIREESKKNGKSLISTILQPPEPLSEATQTVAGEYLALQLSVNDRDRIINTLCKRNPDQMTPLMRGMISGYEPVIRRIHQAVNLPAGLSDIENFLTDVIALSKPVSTIDDREKATNLVPVSGFVKLCEKHRKGSHRFIHELAKNGPELIVWYKAWAQTVATQFRYPDDAKSPLRSLLDPLLDELPIPDRKEVMNEVDKHAEYLAKISSSSDSRARALVAASYGSDGHGSANGKGQGQAGPGVFLTKWQTLIDASEIGPAHEGAIKAGDQRKSNNLVEEEALEAPNVDRTLELLLLPFRNAARVVSEGEHWDY